MGSNGQKKDHASELSELTRPLTLPDSASEYSDARYVIFGVPFDGTSSYRKGSRLAPNRLREAYDNLESFDPQYGVDFKESGIHDLGDIIPSEDAETNVNLVETMTGYLRKDGKIPIMLGGEHSITVGAVRTYSDCAMVIIDAHSDFRFEYMGNRYNHACVTRRSLEILGKGRIASVGTRSISREEFESPEFSDVRFISSSYVRENGIEKVAKELKEMFPGKMIYFSIDMDGIDPAYAPAVGTPEPYGLTHFDVRELIKSLSSSIVAFDIVEFTPLYDNGNTAMLAAKLIQDFIGSRH